MHDGHVPVRILFKSCTLHKIRIHQTHFISRKQAEIFFRRLLHKIIPVDIDLSRKRNRPCAERFVFQIIRYLDLLGLTLRIIVDHQPYRVKRRHHTRTTAFQVLADAVLQHCIINRGLTFGYTAQFHESADRLRRKSPSSERRDRYQTRIIPSVHDPFFY